MKRYVLIAHLRTALQEDAGIFFVNAAKAHA